MNIHPIHKALPPALLIGLAGPAGSGKDSCGDILQGYGFARMAFADALRREVTEAFNLDPRVMVDRALKEVPGPALAISQCLDGLFVRRMYQAGHDLLVARSPRWIIQQWGTEYRRAEDADYWRNIVQLHIAHARSRGQQRIVVTDVRFPNEAALIHGLGGHVLRLHRPNATGTLAPDTATHSSEAAETLPSDAEVHNDGDLDHLHAELVRVVLDLPATTAKVPA